MPPYASAILSPSIITSNEDINASTYCLYAAAFLAVTRTSMYISLILCLFTYLILSKDAIIKAASKQSLDILLKASLGPLLPSFVPSICIKELIIYMLLCELLFILLFTSFAVSIFIEKPIKYELLSSLIGVIILPSFTLRNAVAYFIISFVFRLINLGSFINKSGLGALTLGRITHSFLCFYSSNINGFACAGFGKNSTYNYNNNNDYKDDRLRGFGSTGGHTGGNKGGNRFNRSSRGRWRRNNNNYSTYTDGNIELERELFSHDNTITQGINLMAYAQTGSGEIAAFGLPIIHNLCMNHTNNNFKQKINNSYNNKEVYPSAVISTRLNDLIERGFVRMKAVQYNVLDEADRMLDMRFMAQMKQIVLLDESNGSNCSIQDRVKG